MTATQGPAALRGFRVAVSARADYAVRALVALALEPLSRPMKATTIAARQGIPSRFLANILPYLCRAGIVGSRRGGEGGYWLARPASEITLAEIVRAIEPGPASPLAAPVTGQGGPVTGHTETEPAPAAAEAALPAARGLLDILRVSVQERLLAVLESTTLLDVVHSGD
jgi:Rrf2 family protein